MTDYTKMIPGYDKMSSHQRYDARKVVDWKIKTGQIKKVVKQ